ncbi:MAG: hypothetical protein KAR36_04095, partial [Candidatus Latescibacteria bacterium]|nr:hypothetical protein [Candidatus Latescibacterota bacterium]
TRTAFKLVRDYEIPNQPSKDLIGGHQARAMTEVLEDAQLHNLGSTRAIHRDCRSSPLGTQETR